ncbi:sugar phosphate nucleotidyltransferase [Alphaproteobacteria bacterium]|nr:sugar phosphate nucleotidyltransferase [Alphaproteobacteria bacterium]
MNYCDKVIILAGGQGARIRKAEPNLPKALIAVTDKPILYYIINELMANGIQKFYFSLGYMAPKIVDYVKSDFPNLNCAFFIESTPLGTGGTLRRTLNLCQDGEYLIVNGDTFLRYDICALAKFHAENRSNFSIVSVFKDRPDRYGVLGFQDSQILDFREKQYIESGWINAGHYMINSREFKQSLISFGYDQKVVFSLEDFLERLVGCNQLFGFKVDTDFIDIGIPEDLELARNSFQWGC